MPRSTDSVHGNAPDKCSVALLLIDVINDLDFPEANKILRYAVPAALRLAALAKRAREADVPVIYVNDNFGRWRSDFKAQVEHCLRDGMPGKAVAELLPPSHEDYFVLKPKHSGFFATTLDTLLRYLQVTTVVLAGLATNICVLFTANDAYMRDFRLIVPSDCVAANTAEENRYALEQMRTILKADIRTSTELDFDVLRGDADALHRASRHHE